MNPNIPDFLTTKVLMYAVPFFIIAVLLELFLLKQKAKYEVKDTAASLIMGIGNLVIKIFTGGITFFISLWVWKNWRLFDIHITWYTLVLAFLLEDCCYYWYHRFGHESRWVWAAHINHHTSQHYNLSTALRQTWTGFIACSWIFWIPMALVGFHPIVTGFFSGINLIYQFWIHTEGIKTLGPIEWIFNTPSHHRVHHGKNLKYLDKNYAGILIIWDRMFGTFQKEDPSEPPEYGVIKGIGTFNPLKIAMHEWVSIFKDVMKAKGLKAKLLYAFGRPGWSHDGSRKTVPEMREEAKMNEESPST